MTVCVGQACSSFKIFKKWDLAIVCLLDLRVGSALCSVWILLIDGQSIQAYAFPTYARKF
jgi:hypothetical protein